MGRIVGGGGEGGGDSDRRQNNIATYLTNQINNQSIIPLTDYRTGCRNVSHC